MWKFRNFEEGVVSDFPIIYSFLYPRQDRVPHIVPELPQCAILHVLWREFRAPYFRYDRDDIGGIIAPPFWRDKPQEEISLIDFWIVEKGDEFFLRAFALPDLRVDVRVFFSRPLYTLRKPARYSTPPLIFLFL